MKSGSYRPTVAEKLAAVVALHRAENPGVSLSVSSLAKQAGVSRANLYTSHLDIIESLNAPKRVRTAIGGQKNSQQKISKLEEELEGLKRTNKALLVLNGALRGRVRELQQRLADAAPRARGRRKEP